MARVALCSFFDERCQGLRSVASYLEEAGHEVFLVFFGTYGELRKPVTRRMRGLPGAWGMDPRGVPVLFGCASPPLNEDRALFLAVLRKIAPAIIGFSVRTHTFSVADELARLIKGRVNAPLVYGGVGPSLSPDRAIEVADVVCVGEGEEPMAELADAVDRGADPRRIKNLWVNYRGHVRRNAVRPVPTDLDTLPDPFYDPKREFVIEGGSLGREREAGGVVYETSATRGCFFDCTHCACGSLSRLYKGQGRLVRRRPAKTLVAEIAAAENTRRLEAVSFLDENFLADGPWVSEFARLFRDQVALPFSIYAQPLFAETRSLRELAEAGMAGITVPIPSGSRRLLSQVYGVQASRDQLAQGIRAVLDEATGARPMIEMHLGHPMETEEDRLDTLHFLLGLGRPCALRVFFSGNGGAAEWDGTLAHWAWLYRLAASGGLSPQRIERLRRSRWASKHPALRSGLVLLGSLGERVRRR